ncbi:hypothetical protein LTR85_005929 [Meristemomyces frigidus]|nr:hypothetical protein LTR85_005929 [Meristemomyces frigidus]
MAIVKRTTSSATSTKCTITAAASTKVSKPTKRPRSSKPKKLTKAQAARLAALALQHQAQLDQPDCPLCCEAFSFTPMNSTTCSNDRCHPQERLPLSFLPVQAPDAKLKKSKWWDPSFAELEEMRAATDVVFSHEVEDEMETETKTEMETETDPETDAETETEMETETERGAVNAPRSAYPVAFPGQSPEARERELVRWIIDNLDNYNPARQHAVADEATATTTISTVHANPSAPRPAPAPPVLFPGQSPEARRRELVRFIIDALGNRPVQQHAAQSATMPVSTTPAIAAGSDDQSSTEPTEALDVAAGTLLEAVQA